MSGGTAVFTAYAHDAPRSSSCCRLAAGVTWVALLLGLWLWGRALTEGGGTGPEAAPVRGASGAAPGSRSEAGSEAGSGSGAGSLAAGAPELPAAHDPLPGSPRPLRLDIAAIGVHSRVARHGPGALGWYGDGPVPGAEGAALLVGHRRADGREAVFPGLSATRPGTRVRVARADGTVAEFTVERTKLVRGRHLGAVTPRTAGKGRAELRLIACGDTADEERRARYCASHVVVSAYLTGSYAA